MTREKRRGEGGKKGKRSLCILCEPYCREMAPAELPDDDVTAVGEGVANVYGMVPALDIVFPILFVLGHDRMRVRRVVGVGV